MIEISSIAMQQPNNFLKFVARVGEYTPFQENVKFILHVRPGFAIHFLSMPRRFAHFAYFFSSSSSSACQRRARSFAESMSRRVEESNRRLHRVKAATKKKALFLKRKIMPGHGVDDISMPNSQYIDAMIGLLLQGR